MVFAKILDNIHQCSDLDTNSSGSWMGIRIPNGKFSRKRKFRENFHENETFRKIFSRKVKNFFCENTKTKIFVPNVVSNISMDAARFTLTDAISCNALWELSLQNFA
jgi:hypothetical protein